MREHLTELALFLGQDLTRVGGLTVSEIEGTFETKAFKSWKQARDYSLKLPEAVLKRIDGISKQLNNLGRG